MYVWHAYMLGATCMYVWHSLYVVEQPVCMCGIAYMLWSNLYVCVA